MSDDWLETGHGPDASRLSTVFSRTPGDAGATQAAAPRSRVARSAAPTSVAVALATVMLVGSAGAVYAIRESLFPSLGAATSPSVWQNPASPEPAPALDPDIVTITATTTPTVPSTPAPSTVSSTVSSTMVPDDARATSTTDDHGSGGSGTGSDDSDRDADDSGSDNSGSDNSGSDNSGSDNSGSDNSGSDNSGSDNSGSDNSGSDNSGSGNSGSGSGSDDDSHDPDDPDDPDDDSDDE